MAFQKVTPIKYITYKNQKPGDVIVQSGTFLRADNTGKGVYGDKISFLFREEDGTVIGLNKTGQLAWLVEKHLTPGTVARVTLLGKNKFKNKAGGFTEAWDFELEVDNEKFDSVAATQAMASKPAVTSALSSDISL